MSYYGTYDTGSGWSSTILNWFLLFTIIGIIIGMGYYIYSKRGCPPERVSECPGCPKTPCPDCPPCPDCMKILKEIQKENGHLKEMVKYMSVIIRKNEAQKELYKWQQNAHRVFESPKIRTYNKQIDNIITNVKGDAEKLKFFEDNLNMLI